MSKAVLEFTLPDEVVELHNALDAPEAFSLLCRIANTVRDVEKYGSDPAEKMREIGEDIRDTFPDLDER